MPILSDFIIKNSVANIPALLNTDVSNTAAGTVIYVISTQKNYIWVPGGNINLSDSYNITYNNTGTGIWIALNADNFKRIISPANNSFIAASHNGAILLYNQSTVYTYQLSDSVDLGINLNSGFTIDIVNIGTANVNLTVNGVVTVYSVNGSIGNSQTIIIPPGSRLTLFKLNTATTNPDIWQAQYIGSVAASNFNRTISCSAAATSSYAGTYNNGSSGVGATLTLTATGNVVIDNYTPNVGDLIFFPNQSNPIQNGLYVVTNPGGIGISAVFTRATNYDNSLSGIIKNGDLISVQNGTAYGGTTWYLATTGTIVLGTTSLTYGKGAVVSSEVVGAGNVITKNVSDNTQSVVASASGSFTVKRLVKAIDTNGTIEDGGGISADSNGRITNANQPLVMAYVNANVSNVSGDGTAYQIIFNSTTANQGSMLNTSNGLLSAPVTGNYFIKGTVGYSGLSASYTIALINVITAHGIYQSSSVNPGVVRDGNNNLIVPFDAYLPMTASDTFYVQIIVNGSTKSVGILGGSSNILTRLFVMLLPA